MTKTYLAIAFLITGFLVSDAYGEDEVYYCAETASIGFDYDKKLKEYKRILYRAHKFKIKIDKTTNNLVIKFADQRKEVSSCSNPLPIHVYFSCDDSIGGLKFNFNTHSGRFTLSQNYGYVQGDGDSISISYGTCDKF